MDRFKQGTEKWELGLHDLGYLTTQTKEQVRGNLGNMPQYHWELSLACLIKKLATQKIYNFLFSHCNEPNNKENKRADTGVAELNVSFFFFHR